MESLALVKQAVSEGVPLNPSGTRSVLDTCLHICSWYHHPFGSFEQPPGQLSQQLSWVEIACCSCRNRCSEQVVPVGRGSSIPSRFEGRQPASRSCGHQVQRSLMSDHQGRHSKSHLSKCSSSQVLAAHRILSAPIMTSPEHDPQPDIPTWDATQQADIQGELRSSPAHDLVNQGCWLRLFLNMTSSEAKMHQFSGKTGL